MRRVSLLALAVVAGMVTDGCASTPRPAAHSITKTSRALSGSATTSAANSTQLRCPVTTPPVKPHAGDGSAPLADNPTGALACLANEPAGKRAVIGAGTRLPASVSVVLARLIDQAVPADEATAKRCAPDTSHVLTRFGYPSGTVDVIVSIACPAGHIAYVHDRGYLLPAVLASYLEGTTDPAGRGLAPNLMGQTLAHAVDAARRAGDHIELGGGFVDNFQAGTVLLQYPTLGHQVEVIAAVHHSPPCRAGQLAIQYLPGGAGTGNDFGTILLRNTSAAWCELNGPAAVTGLTGGRLVTNTRKLPVVGDLELSPHAAAAEPGHALPADQLTASLSLSAEYRDDRDGSLCNAHWVIPKTWRMVLDAVTLTVANGRATADAKPPGAGGLITCQGQFGAAPIQASTS
jgi:hypothetical protein